MIQLIHYPACYLPLILQFVLGYRGFHTDWSWVWAGIGVEFAISLILIGLQALALTYLGREYSSAAVV